MKLISLGSSSDGNCHILYTNGVGIMLDCGANVKNINAVIKDYNIKHILLTHKHQDHISSILENKIADKGQFIYGNEDVIDKIKDTKYINKVTLENNKKYVNTIQKVLVEGESKNNKDLLTGRTDSNKVVIFEGDKSLIGKMVDLKIVSEHMWYLKGEIQR